MRLIGLVLLLFVGILHSFAQQNKRDSSNYRTLSPRKATLYSAVCPGLGQIYNQKVWKAGVIYAGFTGISFGYIYNQKRYKSFQNAVNLRYDSSASTVDTEFANLNDATVKYMRDYHRRNRDICILAFVGLYALNIIDANVDAHLQEFKINKDLSMAWQPTFNLSANQRLNSGLQLTFTF